MTQLSLQLPPQDPQSAPPVRCSGSVSPTTTTLVEKIVSIDPVAASVRSGQGALLGRQPGESQHAWECRFLRALAVAVQRDLDGVASPMPAA